MKYIKKKFFRICDCNKFITILSLKNNELRKKLNEIDESIERCKKISDLPADTSKFNDEFNLTYAENRKKIIDEIEENDMLINQHKKKVEIINESINSLPDGIYKEILKKYYIDGENIKNITYQSRCSRQTVYNLVHKVDSGV